jgi:hypothetical protein
LLNNEQKLLGPNQNSTELLKQIALHIYFQFLKMNFPHEHSDPPHDKLILGAQSGRNVGDEKQVARRYSAPSRIPPRLEPGTRPINASTVGFAAMSDRVDAEYAAGLGNEHPIVSGAQAEHSFEFSLQPLDVPLPSACETNPGVKDG